MSAHCIFVVSLFFFIPVLSLSTAAGGSIVLCTGRIKRDFKKTHKSPHNGVLKIASHSVNNAIYVAPHQKESQF